MRIRGILLLASSSILTVSCLLGQETQAPAETIQVAALNSEANLLLPGMIKAAALAPVERATCDPLDLQLAPELSFSQRTCLLRSHLLSRGLLFRSAGMSAWSEWRNTKIQNPGTEDFTRRFAGYYARRAARESGELIAGYLNHEDPRYHLSQQSGTWKRSRAALLSVLAVKNADGNSRLALAPIAGAFGSGMVGMAMSQSHNSLHDGLRRSATSYGFYFSNALLHEFHPELAAFANRFLHRH